ncbi:MAG: GyrI-like domain-containing protein [Microbacteriaceae bacterium]|nr:GyrI-like domain-containing protein [Microbacteriaceae bacterium]MCL2793854.1 GyrI-like domain-containing protein [Microbacteriaceae bacterium]
MTTESVRITTIAARPTAVIRRVTNWAEFPKLWMPLLDEVYLFARAHPELATGGGGERWQNVMLYTDQTPTVEVGVLAAAAFESDGEVVCSALPGGEVVTALHRGDYSTLGETHQAARDHAAARGRELAGPCWEIYGHATPNPDDAETEVFWLLIQD